MKVCIAGPRDFNDYDMLLKAIEKSGFEITEVVSGKAKGVDTLGERWAEENSVPIKEFPAEWKNMNLPGAVVKQNKFGAYNATAGFHRNGLMCEYADALIAIDLNTNGTANMVKQMEEAGKKVFKFDPRDAVDEEDVGYVF